MLGDLQPCATTGVGSLPFDRPDDAVAHVASSYDVPFCPQLPALEGDMVARWLGVNPGRCGWSPERDRERPPAWNAFLRSLRLEPPAGRVAKLQVTGPLTLAVALESHRGEGSRRAAIELAGEVSSWLAAAVGAQARALAEIDVTPLVVIDEPSLEALALDPARAAPVWDPVRSVTPAWGLHVCCRVPWDVVEHAEPDLISFDLAGTHSTDRRGVTALERAVRRGGRVAWGVTRVDSDDGPASAARWLSEAVSALTARGLDRDRVLDNSLLTPSCGTALVSPDRERALASALDAAAAAARASVPVAYDRRARVSVS